MKICFASARSRPFLSFLLFLLPALVMAQQMPVTGQMMGQGSTATAAPTRSASAPPQPSMAATTPLSSAPAAPSAGSRQPMAAMPAPAYVATVDPAPSVVVSPRPHATVVGETTQHLLQMQADGTQAGRHLPMLGAEASASYDRYLKSFSHEIPEFYKTTVGKDSNGNAGGE